MIEITSLYKGDKKIPINRLLLTIFERSIDRFFSNIRLNRIYNQNSKKLKLLKNLHKNERCFIIGTGPSLNKTDLSLIKDEIIFGVNTLYRGFPRYGIECTYYAVSDELVWENHYHNILNVNSILFLVSYCGKNYLQNQDFYKKIQNTEPYVIRILGPLWDSSNINFNVSHGCYGGETIIIDLCLQMAFYMGFKEVFLLGCDCDYSGLHRFDGLETDCLSAGAIGDWSKVFSSYEICKRIYEEDGREIINCTVGGKLEIFKRKRLEEII